MSWNEWTDRLLKAILKLASILDSAWSMVPGDVTLVYGIEVFLKCNSPFAAAELSLDILSNSKKLV